MDAVVVVLVLVWIAFSAVALQVARVNSPGASIATWLGLTLVSWCLEFGVAFLAVHAILFSLGREAALVLVLVAAAVVTLTPAAWAYGLGRWNKRRSALN